MEFQDVVGDEYSEGISCSSFLASFRLTFSSVTRCNDSLWISIYKKACCCSSTVKVSDFGKLAHWRADGCQHAAKVILFLNFMLILV
ncbi:hypothetical protein Bca4012_027349 [Brassica carinata]